MAVASVADRDATSPLGKMMDSAGVTQPIRFFNNANACLTWERLILPIAPGNKKVPAGSRVVGGGNPQRRTRGRRWKACDDHPPRCSLPAGRWRARISHEVGADRLRNQGYSTIDGVRTHTHTHTKKQTGDCVHRLTLMWGQMMGKVTTNALQ